MQSVKLASPEGLAFPTLKIWEPVLLQLPASYHEVSWLFPDYVTNSGMLASGLLKLL